MTTSHRRQAEPDPGHRDAGPAAPDLQPPEGDLHELRDHSGAPFPGRDARRPLRRPEYAIVVDQVRGTGAPPSLAELLENLTAFYAKHPEAEPDLEAEP